MEAKGEQHPEVAQRDIAEVLAQAKANDVLISGIREARQSYQHGEPARPGDEVRAEALAKR